LLPLWSFQGAMWAGAHSRATASLDGLSKLNSVLNVEVDVRSRRARSPDGCRSRHRRAERLPE